MAATGEHILRNLHVTVKVSLFLAVNTEFVVRRSGLIENPAEKDIDNPICYI